MNAEKNNVENNHKDSYDSDFQSCKEEIVHWSLQIGNIDGDNYTENVNEEDGQDGQDIVMFKFLCTLKLCW